jgi:hypothetical protein
MLNLHGVVNFVIGAGSINGPAPHTRGGLGGGRRLLGNTIWNIAGGASPLLFAAFAVPPTIRCLGTAWLGILATSWLMLSYLGGLDLGVARALTKFRPEAIARGQSDELPRHFWTALELVLLIAVVVMVVGTSGLSSGSL